MSIFQRKKMKVFKVKSDFCIRKTDDEWKLFTDPNN